MKPIKCNFCDRYFNTMDSYTAHIEKQHNDQIPQDMTHYQYLYFLKTGKKSGKCVMCGNETLWNTKTNKYKRFC